MTTQHPPTPPTHEGGPYAWGPPPPRKRGRGLKVFLIVFAAVLTAIILAFVGCAALLSESIDDAAQADKAGAITAQQFRSIERGDRLSDVIDQLGEPKDRQTTKAGGITSVCIYYPVDNDQILDDYQFCFDNGRLTSKSDY